MAIKFLATADATYGGEQWSGGLSGGDIVSTPILASGVRTFRFNSGGGGAQVRALQSGIMADTGTRFTSYIRLATFPASTTAIWGNGGFVLACSSTGVIQLQNGDISGAGFGATSNIAIDTTYRLAISYVITSSTDFTIKVWVDGVLVITATQADVTIAGTFGSSLRLGWNADPGASKIMYATHVYVDDSSALSDPGDIRVTAKLPASNSTNAWNTNIGANPANRWTNVNERALSETNGWEETALAAVEESYGIEAAAAGDVDVSAATVVGHGAWIWAKGGAGGLGSPKLIRNGTDVAVVLTASPAYYANYTTSATYPSGVIGMKSAGVLDTTFLYETGMLIAYIPGTVTYDFTFINPWMISA